MLVEIEYIVRKKAKIKVNDYDRIAEALKKTDWKKDHRVTINKPEIIGKRVLEDDIVELDKEGNYNLKEGVVSSKRRITSIKEWLEVLKEETEKIHKENPHWPQDKCKFVARGNMSPPPSDGWS